MPSKTEEYLALAQRTANGLTRYWESWTDYLTTASRLYKYPFADQLMIYAQRPDATACAEFDIWRNRMNRYVRRGSKGIALLDESSGFPRLHYVFDVSDTGVRRNSRDPEMWQYNDDLKQPVSEMLSKTYGISGERVSQQLADVAGKLVADYWDNNGGDIRAIVDGSLLMDYDEAGVEMQFKSAAAISVTYTLLERCGFEPAGWFDKDDFRAIHEFSTPDSVYALGAAVSDMSREVLRNIERTVKTTIRRRNAERSQYEYEQQERDLLDRRGLPSPEPDPEPAPEAAGQVRQAAPDVPDEPSPGAVQHDAPEREPVPAPDGGGADGREPDAADHEAASETEPGPGQGAESDGVGAAHEQPAGTVRGTGADGTDLQLSFFDAHIPTEAEQIETIDRAESEKTPSAFVLSQAEIENELRKHGSGFTGGKQRIMALYQTQPDRKLRAKALAKEYGIGGHSHDYLDGSRGFVNHDGRGMEFDHYPEHKKFTLSWTQVEKYIDLMIQSDRYLTDKEKEHYTPPVSAEPDATLTHAKNLIREFCQEEYDSEPDFSDLSKIGVAYTNATDENPQRRIALVKQYNELFNSTRPREYDGSHIHFVGMNPEITLREHQRNAIAHVLYGGNTLLAHEVGAGKTYEMAASAMEAKRLGLCQKSLFVVPNHLTEQWASEFLNLYPNAKLLVARRKDFETANRKKFCARIATGDYDAVIIGHSQFERIPLSFERQERIIQEQIYETLAAINELKVHAGENFSIKQMEKTRKTLETKLEKLRSDERKDDVITFEQLGVDRLFVDESHFYKNLFLTTKMRNVAGLSTSEAQKSSDMFGKCRYLDEITGGRGVVFATGTPVSNSMTELYTVMRYLQYSTLQQKKLTHFDCWASTFGETTTAIELAPEGTGYRARTRFAKFFNLPELMSMFKEVADIKTSDQLHLPVPEAKFETVVAKPSEIQKEMVQELSKRAAEIHSGTVDASVDNMLCVTNDGRKIGLDVRLMNPMLPDDPNSKLNVCVRNVLKIWDEGKDQKLTQLLFCDLSTPKNDGNFNVYDDIRKKLVAAGVPENEIEFIHNADTEAKKAALFSKVRSGDVRVLLGSTAKMGAGTNVQSRLVAVHHLDVGWKPSDMTQRNGRIIRQGNMNKEVKVFNYVTEGTFDSYLFQTLENKQRFISQIMTSKSPVRSCEDVDEQALSYAEIKALCAGNPLIKEKMDLDVQVAKLKVLKADHQSQKFRLQDKLLTKFPADIRETNAYIAGVKADAQLAAAHPQVQEGFCGMTIKGVTYDEKKTAGERLVLACSELPNAEEKVIGSYRGFELSLRFDTFRSEYQAILKGERRYPVALGTDPLGNIIRLDNSLNNFPERINSAENELATLHQQQAAAQIEVEKPFPQEEELAEKSARLAELNAQLDVDEKNHEPEQDEEEQEDAPRRPSVLAALEEKSDKPEPVKPFRSYYDKDGDAR